MTEITSLLLSTLSILLSLSVLLTITLDRKKDKGLSSAQRKYEEKLLKLYGGLEEMILDFEKFIEKSKMELKSQGVASKVAAKHVSLIPSEEPQPVKRGRGRPRKKVAENDLSEDKKTDNNKKSRSEEAEEIMKKIAAKNGVATNTEIMRLLKLGITVDEIATKLKRTKGEILLIQALIKN